MPFPLKTPDVTNLILLVILIWIYGAGGGLMEKKWAKMKAMHEKYQEEKTFTLPIPIPVIIKEKQKGDSMPAYYPLPYKEEDKGDVKDFVWKMMMLKYMAKGDKSKSKCCSKKIIMFPFKSKGCDKGCKKKKSCDKCCPEMMTTPPPDEYEYEYDATTAGPLTGWETNYAPVYQSHRRNSAQKSNRRSDKFKSEDNNKKGDVDGNLSYETGETSFYGRGLIRFRRPNFENDFDY